MVDRRVLALTAAGLLAVAWIFYVAGNAAPSWAVASAISFTGLGLWNFPAESCSTAGFCSKILATRAFMTLVCILTPFAVGCLVFVIIMNSFDSPLLLAGKVLAIVCFLFGLIGMAVGLSFVTDMSSNVGAAGGVSIVGVILNLAGAIAAGLIGAK